MKYQTVGAAWNHKSKTGNQFISLKLDADALKAIIPEDLQSKLCLFLQSKKTEKSPDYVISAPMPDDFVSKYSKED